MLQQPRPDDFVIATGETHSVREFVVLAFKEVGINVKWVGKGADEKGLNAGTNEVLIEVDRNYFRPTEVDVLEGDASKAKEKLGWQPKVTFRELVKTMLIADLKEAERELLCKRNGL